MSDTPKPLSLPIAHALDPRLSQVLEYWLGAEMPTNESALSRKSLWFTKSETTDEEIRHLFGAVLQEALAGKLDGEAMESPLGLLSVLIVLDQFTRNLFRGTARSFAGDPQALQLALDGIALGHDRHADLPAVARIFCYLPLEHAEDLALQDRSVAAFQALADQAGDAGGEGVREFLAGTLDYAHRHRDVIVRYGRFPHRNAILGRTSTAEELQYLSQPGSGF